MSPNAVTMGQPAPRLMQDVTPPYARALKTIRANSAAPTPTEPAPTPTPTPQVTPPAQPMPETPQPAQPAPELPTSEPQAPVVQAEEPAQPLFPQVQAVDNHPPAQAPMAYTPKAQPEGQAVAQASHRPNTNWLIIGLAVIVAVALAAAAVSAMRG